MTVSLPVVWAVELLAVTLSVAGSFWIAKQHVRTYAVLYAFSAAVGIVLCLAFVYAGFYSFPVKLVPYTPIPLVEMATIIPFFVLFGVKYSPESWAWKLPFYFATVQLIMLFELIALVSPLSLIDYKKWDVWDSYTAWWLYLLFFEWMGGKIVPRKARSPLAASSFRYGRWGWVIVHAIAMTTVFLAGVYAGWGLRDSGL
ncbi:CBO0543 family protein [Geobacillus thermoleovorans]|uniref:CBO0543 family protein n=1 Tax=Geobacillus thermoleovorans TaxID=33941 RepID=UPI00345C0B09